MNKAVSRFKRTFKIFGIKFCETNEEYERVDLENVDPITPFVVTEYEVDKWKQVED